MRLTSGSGHSPGGRSVLQPHCSRGRPGLASHGRRADKLTAAGSMTGGRAAPDVELAPIESVEGRSSAAPPRNLKYRLIAADALVVSSAIVFAFVWQSLVRSDAELGVQRTHLVLATLTFPVWIVSFSLNKLYLARAV